MIYHSFSLTPAESDYGVLALVRDGASPQPLIDKTLLCEDEEMASETSLSFCSGVLVQDGLLVTAAHCALRYPCQQWSVQSRLSDASAAVEETATCIEVLALVDDVAVVKVGSSPNVIPASLRTSPIESSIEGSFVAYPLGTAAKRDADAIIETHWKGDGLFTVGADTFGGSSGGGFFDHNEELIAIFSAGLSDFDHDEISSCMRLVEYAGPPVERAYSPLPALAAACDSFPDLALCPSVLSAYGDTRLDEPSEVRITNELDPSSGMAMGGSQSRSETVESAATETYRREPWTSSSPNCAMSTHAPPGSPVAGLFGLIIFVWGGRRIGLLSSSQSMKA